MLGMGMSRTLDQGCRPQNAGVGDERVTARLRARLFTLGASHHPTIALRRSG